jgi:hypothetical protein
MAVWPLMTKLPYKGPIHLGVFIHDRSRGGVWATYLRPRDGGGPRKGGGCGEARAPILYPLYSSVANWDQRDLVKSQDEPNEVHEAGRIHTPSGCNGVHVVSLYPLIWRSLMAALSPPPPFPMRPLRIKPGVGDVPGAHGSAGRGVPIGGIQGNCANENWHRLMHLGGANFHLRSCLGLLPPSSSFPESSLLHPLRLRRTSDCVVSG